MIYLITGGAGFLGINLCRYLLARGHTVRSLDIAAFEYLEADRVDAILGDIRDREAVDTAMRDVDVVVHAAAALPLSPTREIMSTDVGGTQSLLEQAALHRFARFIFISSTSVYGVPGIQPPEYEILLVANNERVGVRMHRVASRCETMRALCRR